jgi:hypothetical protein
VSHKQVLKGISSLITKQKRSMNPFSGLLKLSEIKK